MPTIQAFRGLRYNLGQVGTLSDVLCPPYDVIGPELQDQLYKRHPANYIRVELNREEPGDDEHSNKYTRAAKFLKQWKQEGVLTPDPAPALYVYHQIFTYQGREYTRRGFMCRVQLERFGQGKIYPHEETHAGPKADRMLLTKACKANLSQIFGLYPDPENAAQDRLEESVRDKTPIEAVDHLGVKHRLWMVSDGPTIAAVAGIVGPKPMFIADGHHRYETACNYRDFLAESGPLDPNHPANYVLTQCVSMNDPGLIVMPTHRLFRGMPAMTATDLANRLGSAFDVRVVGKDPKLAPDLWERIETDGEQGQLGFYTAADNTWSLASVTDAGLTKMAQIATDHSADWQSLGVSLLHRLVMESLLGVKDLPKPMYVHSVEEVVEGLEKGDAVGRDATGQMGQGGRFELACLVMPAEVDHVRIISEHGERMPAKSTYFYPKLMSGMAVHSLE